MQFHLNRCLNVGQTVQCKFTIRPLKAKWSAISLTAAIAACSVPGPPSTEPQREAASFYPRDTTLFGAVVNEIPAIWARGTLTIEPRPLIAVEAGSMPVNALAGRLESDTAEISTRRMTLARYGVRETSNIDPKDCPGYFVSDSVNPGCPSTRETRVAISRGRPVPGGLVPGWPGGGRGAVPAPAAGKKADEVVQLVIVGLAPHGSSITTFDYYMTKANGYWQVVTRRQVMSEH